MPPYFAADANLNFDDISGGNRETDANFVKAQILEKITYPTGGRTELTYESHDYGYVQDKILETLNYYETENRTESLHANGSQVGNNPMTVSKEFSVVSTNTTDWLLMQISAGGITYKLQNLRPIVNLYKKNATAWINIYTSPLDPSTPNAGYPTSINAKRAVQAGTYKIEIVADLENTLTKYEYMDLFVSWIQPKTNKISQKVAGGLRVKEIKTFDGVNPTPIKKSYGYTISEGGKTISSGVLNGEPIYLQDNLQKVVTNLYNCTLTPATYNYKSQSGSSVIVYGQTSGNHLGYRRVIVSQLGNGSAIKEFSSPYEYPDLVNFRPPFADPTSNSYKTGLILKETVLNESNQQVKLTTYDYFYKVTDIYSGKVSLKIPAPWGVGIGLTGDRTSQITGLLGFGSYWNNLGRNATSFNPLRLGYSQLKTMTTTLDGVSTTNNYTYDSNLQLKKTESIQNSDFKTYLTTYDYATDVNDLNLIGKFMVGIPLKVTQTVGTKTKASLVQYDLFNTTQVLPKYIKELTNDGTTWVTRLYVSTYNTDGLPTTAYANNSTTPETYSWNTKLLLTGKIYGGLTWAYTYKTNTRLMEYTTDENGLKKRFTYDDLMRLSIVYDRMQPDGVTDPQTTTTFSYQYKNLTDPNSFNYVQTSTSFSGSATPLVSRQVMDGLGRNKMGMKIGYTPANQNLKSFVTYDALGRVDLSYQPFESATTLLDASVPSSTLAVQTLYEASPLSRPIKQIAEDGKFLTTQYGYNSSGEVRYFTNVSNGDGTNVITPASSYTAIRIYKTSIFNENWNNNIDDKIGRTDIFKDILGRVILTRKFAKDVNNVYQRVDTYNVYDDYGNLVMVIPPGATDASQVNGSIDLSLVFEYNYDKKNRLCRKKVPGADWVNFYFDSRDLLVLTQDANMRTPQYTGDDGAVNKYLATFYDEIGRVKKTGFAFVNPTVGQDFNLQETNITKLLTETQYYTNKSWVKHQGAKVIAPAGVTTNRNFVWSYIERRDVSTYTGNPVWTGKQHLLLANQPERPILDSDAYGVDWHLSGYDGLQKPTVSLHYLFTGTAHPEVRTCETYNYDNGQRLTNLNHIFTLNGVGLTTPTFTLSNMVYNYKDQLTRKNIANINGKFLQSTDYTYNLRGWLTSIGGGNLASPTNDYPNFQCTDYAAFSSGQYNDYVTLPYPNSAIGQGNPSLFSEKIRYEAPNAYPNNGSVVTPQYNGNISQVEWQVAGREPQAYTFKYDNLDRLTEANYSDIHTGTWNTKGWTSPYESDNKFQEKVSYDLRGNIQSLERNGLLYNSSYSTTNGTTNKLFLCGYFRKIDNLTYAYGDSNRLKKVTDASAPDKGFMYGNTGNPRDYEYDKNGNLTADRNKGITNIQYNYLNLPQLITFTGNRTIGFVYDASGAKLQKITNNNGTIVTQNYIGGVEYIGNTLERIPHSEGEIVNRGGSYVYEYALKDHLGNTRVTFTNNPGTNTLYATDIKQINHYYPFGLNMEGPGFGAQGANKYQYNGKELNSDFGLNWNDYGARFYDAAVGRFPVVDPLSEKSFGWNPYRYAFNNPLKYIDPTGMSETGWIEREDGTAYYDKDVHSKKDLKNSGRKDEKYLGEDVVLKNKGTENSYLGMADGSLTATTNNGEAAVVKPRSNPHDPAYSPYNPAAVGIQASGTLSYGMTSYSFTIGLAVGPGEAGLFYSTAAGIGTGSPVDLSGGVSAFWSDKTDDGYDENGNPNVALSLSNLEGGGLSLAGNVGAVNLGLSQGTVGNSLTLSKATYRTKSVGFGIPRTKGFGIKAEKTDTKFLGKIKL